MDKVVVKYGEVRRIARLKGVTEQTVISALNFKYDTKLAEQIRQVAIKRGGKLMVEKV